MKKLLTIASASVLLLCLTAFTHHQSGLGHYRAGSQAVVLLILSTNVTFSTPMNGTNYALHFAPSAAAFASYSAKTATGFTLVLSAGLNGYVDWVAIESQ